MPSLLQNIPTNVITGFLGVGKTTAILNLLQNKPAGETWAVLVNEFGKIGIDGQLLKQDGVEIKELPGGCMCCSGVSVQVGLNALLASARPDRLLIEPTGAGHPRQIIKQLLQPPFDQVLDMRACICLVDPRHLSDERYVSNDNYQEQLEIADVLVANKTDLSSDSDKEAFDALVSSRPGVDSAWAEHGQLELALLDQPHQTQQLQRKSLINLRVPAPIEKELEALELEEGEHYRRVENHAEDLFSCGWLFSDEIEFDLESVRETLSELDAERIKATLKTEQGGYSINSVKDDMDIKKVAGPTNSRIEIIAFHKLDWQSIERSLLQSFASKL